MNISMMSPKKCGKNIPKKTLFNPMKSIKPYETTMFHQPIHRDMAMAITTGDFNAKRYIQWGGFSTYNIL